jgi:hypothetical protein
MTQVLPLLRGRQQKKLYLGRGDDKVARTCVSDEVRESV